MATLAELSPVTARLAVVLSLSVPLFTSSVTSRLLAPASTSVMEIRLEFAVLKVRGISSSMACSPGTLFKGGSLKGCILMVMSSVSFKSPGSPVKPLSSVTIVNVSAPLKFRMGE